MSDCEIPSYYKVTEPVARKTHECCECSAAILPQEKYLQVNACWDGSPDVFRQHQLCAQACMFIRDKGWFDDECLPFGFLNEYLNEYHMDVNRVAHIDDKRKFWRMILNIRRRERKPK